MYVERTPEEKAWSCGPRTQACREEDCSTEQQAFSASNEAIMEVDTLSTYDKSVYLGICAYSGNVESRRFLLLCQSNDLN